MAYTAVNKAADFNNTTLYTGDGVAIGSGGQAITGVGFQPDMVWVKQRSGTEKHDICDAARGTTKTVTPDSTASDSATVKAGPPGTLVSSTDHAFAPGITIYGRWTRINLATGSVVAYLGS